MNIRSSLVKLYYFILTRRYRIKIIGSNILETPGAMLMLPNHQSHIDPQLMAVIVAQYCEFVPVVSERFLKIPIISSFLKEWNAVAVSDFRGGNRDPNVLKNIFSQVMNALNKGRSVIIYPSGTITFTPTEKIRNKQSAYVIVSDLPENARVIGVRIRGLWGSMWSVAWMGERPSFILTYLKGVFFFFANLIFFVPKRDVSFEFVDITDEAKKMAQSDRATFNTFMEDFYNINGPEQVTYIKHLFFFPKSRRKLPKNLSET